MTRFLSIVLLLVTGWSGAVVAATDTLNDQLVYRTTFGRAEDVRILLSRGADANAKNRLGETVMSIAIQRNGSETLPMVQALVEAGVNIDEVGKSGDTPLIFAIRKQQPEVVQYLLARGADYFARDAQGLGVHDIAKAEGGEKVFAVVDALQKAYDERLRQEHSVDNLRKLVKEYTFLSCASQYLAYHADSKQDPVDPEVLKTRLATNDARIEKIAANLHNLFYIKLDNLVEVREVSGELIYNELQAMISNRNRRDHGVGKDSDINKRCGKIAGLWKVAVKEDEHKVRRVTIESATALPRKPTAPSNGR